MSVSDFIPLYKVIAMIEYFQPTPWFSGTSLYSRWTGALSLPAKFFINLANLLIGYSKKGVDLVCASRIVSVFMEAPTPSGGDSEPSSEDSILFHSTVFWGYTEVARGFF